MKVRCAECLCFPEECRSKYSSKCSDCIKDVCCCNSIHAKEIKERRSLYRFLLHAKGMYAAALGLEILCIVSAEIGENVGLYLFGLNVKGTPLAFVMGYGLAGFTTFVMILGRYNYGSRKVIDTCCSVLEQTPDKRFIPNLIITFRNFASGIVKIPSLYKEANLKYILKTSLVLMITAESACILTAETFDVLLYRHSIFVAVFVALLAGAFTVVAPEAYKKMKAEQKLFHES